MYVSILKCFKTRYINLESIEFTIEKNIRLVKGPVTFPTSTVSCTKSKCSVVAGNVTGPFLLQLFHSKKKNKFLVKS